MQLAEMAFYVLFQFVHLKIADRDHGHVGGNVPGVVDPPELRAGDVGDAPG